MRMFIPDLTPGPTTMGSISRNLTMLARKECITFGTTEATITSSTSCGEYPLIRRNSVIISPYSSEV